MHLMFSGWALGRNCGGKEEGRGGGGERGEAVGGRRTRVVGGGGRD